MSEKTRRQVNAFLSRLEDEHGYDPVLKRRLRPIVERIVGTGPDQHTRDELMRLIGDTYGHHIRLRQSIANVRVRLRHRLNEAYGRALGIEPPGL